MPFISVFRRTARTPIGVLFALDGALVASNLALRAKQRRIRFAFEPKAVGGAGSPADRRRILAFAKQKRVPSCNKRTVKDACPYKRYLTFPLRMQSETSDLFAWPGVLGRKMGASFSRVYSERKTIRQSFYKRPLQNRIFIV